jgi:hypothetical protein
MPAGGNGAVSSLQTQQRLQWRPRELGLLADIGQNYPA